MRADELLISKYNCGESPTIIGLQFRSVKLQPSLDNLQDSGTSRMERGIATRKTNLPIYLLSVSLIFVGVSSISQADEGLKGPLNLAKLQAEIESLKAQEKVELKEIKSLEKLGTLPVGAVANRFLRIENRLDRIETALNGIGTALHGK